MAMMQAPTIKPITPPPAAGSQPSTPGRLTDAELAALDAKLAAEEQAAAGDTFMTSGMGDAGVPILTSVAQSTAQRVMRTVLPTAGGVLGGLAGARGGTIGAILGGGIGSALGEGASILGEKAIGIPFPPAKDVAGRMAEAAAWSVGSDAVTAGGVKMAKGLFGRVTPQALEAAKFLMQPVGRRMVGRTLARGARAVGLGALMPNEVPNMLPSQMIGGGWLTNILENAGRSSYFGGGKLTEAANATNRQMNAEIEKRIGTRVSDAELGDTLSRSAQGAALTAQARPPLPTEKPKPEDIGAMIKATVDRRSPFWQYLEKRAVGPMETADLESYARSLLEKQGAFSPTAYGPLTRELKILAGMDETAEKTLTAELTKNGYDAAKIAALKKEDPDLWAEMVRERRPEFTTEQARTLLTRLDDIIAKNPVKGGDAKIRATAEGLRDALADTTGFAGAKHANVESFATDVMQQIARKHPTEVAEQFLTAAPEDIARMKTLLDPKDWEKVEAATMESLLVNPKDGTLKTLKDLNKSVGDFGTRLDSLLGKEANTKLTAYRTRLAKTRFDDLVRMANKQPSALVDTLHTMAPEDLRLLHESGTGRARQQMEQATVQSLLEGSTGNTLIGADELAKRVAKLGEQRADILLSPETRASIQQLERMFKVLQPEGQKDIGRLMVQFTQGGAVLTLVTAAGAKLLGKDLSTGQQIGAAAAGGILLGPALIAKALRSPATRAALMSSFNPSAAASIRAKAAQTLLTFAAREATKDHPVASGTTATIGTPVTNGPLSSLTPPPQIR